MKPVSFCVLGIDPGAVAGIVVVRLSARDMPPRGRVLVPSVVDGRVVESAGMIQDPATPAMEIVRVALLLASMHEVAAIGIEIPKGPSRRERQTAYGAQRETIGAVRGGLAAHGWEVVPVSPNVAKKALCNDGNASKLQMVESFRQLPGWQRCWDTAKYRLEAKADAAGIALAAGKVWEQQGVRN